MCERTVMVVAISMSALENEGVYQNIPVEVMDFGVLHSFHLVVCHDCVDREGQEEIWGKGREKGGNGGGEWISTRGQRSTRRF